MADITTLYTLTTPGPDILFNNGTLGDGTDKYWISAIQGLDGPSIRAPVDNVPFGDGGLIHSFWLGPRRVIIDGMLLLDPNTAVDCMLRRNTLAEELLEALAAIRSPASGTLTWNFETQAGTTAYSLTVFNEVPLQITYTDNYMVANFSFGLVSASADPA